MCLSRSFLIFLFFLCMVRDVTAGGQKGDGVFLKCDLRNERTGERRASYFNVGKNSYGIPYWREFNFAKGSWGDSECYDKDHPCEVSDHLFRRSWTEGSSYEVWSINRHNGEIKLEASGRFSRDPHKGVCSVGKPPGKEDRRF